MLKLSWAQCVAVAMALTAGQPVTAQTAKPAGSSGKTVAAKPAQTVVVKRTAVRKPEAAAALAPVVLPALSSEQMAIANRVALGKMPCELSAHVVVKPDLRGAGRFVLELGKHKYHLVPVPSLTGAIRLEDEQAGVVWLQLSNKSMLMSQKHGKRLADACASADQLIVALELERNPAPSLLDAPLLVQAFVPSEVAVAPQFSRAAEDAAK